jgi:hypothetical protein
MKRTIRAATAAAFAALLLAVPGSVYVSGATSVLATVTVSWDG